MKSVARAALTFIFILILAACDLSPKPAREPLSRFLTRADLLMEEQQVGEAVETLEQAAEAHSHSALPLIKIGQMRLLQHRWPAAEDAFNRALARELANPVALAGLAEATLNQGRLDSALNLWSDTTQLAPNQPGAFTGLGRTHLLRFDVEAARSAFIEQEDHHPDPDAQWYLAAIEAPTNLSVAVELLESIPSDSPPDLQMRRDYLAAVLTPFNALSPVAEVAQATGIAFVQIEFWPLAVHALRTANESPGQSQTDQAKTLAFLGYALAQSGRPALDLFKQASTLDPTSALPAYFHGIYLRRQGALRAAEQRLNAAMELDPDNAAIHIELARTKMEQGDLTTAEAEYNTASALAEDDVQIQLLQIQFYANRGYRIVEAGIPAAEALLETHGDNAEAHDLLGWMQFLSGETDKAEASLRTAVELDPALMSAHYHLGRYLESAGKHDEARLEYRLVLNEDLSGTYRNQAFTALQRLDSQ